jgi:hypothetical protein
MTDRELLEAAAKAAGLTILHWPQDDYTIVQDGARQYGWNPLVFDSDALRLAVTLRIDINHDRKLGIDLVYAAAPGTLWSQASEERYGADPYAATRRAIVRAAAEIGRNMT